MAEELHDLERDLIRAVLTCYHTTRLADVSPEAHIQGKPLFRKAAEALLRSPAGGAGAGVDPADIAWLADLKEGGHCGEGTLDRRLRAGHNERIDRLLSAVRGAWKPDREAVARLREWLRVCDEESFFDWDKLEIEDIRAVLPAAPEGV